MFFFFFLFGKPDAPGAAGETFAGVLFFSAGCASGSAAASRFFGGTEMNSPRRGSVGGCGFLLKRAVSKTLP